jgi:hypothetical protein
MRPVEEEVLKEENEINLQEQFPIGGKFIKSNG